MRSVPVTVEAAAERSPMLPPPKVLLPPPPMPANSLMADAPPVLSRLRRTRDGSGQSPDTTRHTESMPLLLVTASSVGSKGEHCAAAGEGR